MGMDWRRGPSPSDSPTGLRDKPGPMSNEGLAVTDQPLTRREMLVRGAGAVAAAGAFTAGAFWLHDPTGQAGLHTGTRKELVPKNFFAEEVLRDQFLASPR